MGNANLILQIIKRFKSENPAFWAKISKYGLILAFLFFGLNWLVEYEVIEISAKFQKLLTGLNGIFIGMFLTGRLGTTDVNLLDEDVKSKVIDKVSENKDNIHFNEG